ncbi:glycosyltransferase [Burkholderiales bacterium]|nr:glycosyltransferase [Burkholderiales bacterium]
MILLTAMPFQAQKSLILTAYPLSAPFDRAVRDVIGQEAQTVTVAQLRSQGLTGLLRQLWSMRGDPIVLPIEEENSSALLPVLKLLAACSRSRSICVVHPNLRRETVSRWRIALDALRFASASVSCLWSAYRAHRELSALLMQPRVGSGSLAANGLVLYLKTNLWFGIKAGGSVGHIAGVVNGLQRLGYPVTFASAEPPVMIDDAVKFLPVQPPTAFGLPYELNNYRFQEGFESTLEAGAALVPSSLIYQRLSAANYLGAVLSRRHRLPLVVEYNGSEVWVAKHWGRGMKFQKLAEMAEEAMLRHAHLVVTISEVLRDELIERGVEPARIVCYPNCIDPGVFTPDRFSLDERQTLRARYGIPADSIVLAFIGTFGQWHGAEMLAQAIARLYVEESHWLIAHKVHFLLVGDGLKMPLVRATIEGSGAGAICTLAGLVPQDQAGLHLAASDILVSPHVPNSDGTRFFGSPTKLFEYMAMGKGIVASNLDQIGEVLSPGLEAGALPAGAPDDDNPGMAVLCEPGNLEELIRGLRFMVERQDWRSILGRNSRQRALDKYTWGHHIQAILDGLSRVE